LRFLAGLAGALGLTVLLGFLAFLVLVLLVAGRGLDQVGGRPLPWIALQALAVLAAGTGVALLPTLAQRWRVLRCGERAQLACLAAAVALFLPWMRYWHLLWLPPWLPF
jgi:hypothetical protein